MFKLRIDSAAPRLDAAAGRSSTKASRRSASARRRPTGYSTLGPPSGKYIAPADSLDCIETVRGWGDCGLRSVVLTGPMFKQFDVGISKRVAVWSQANVEFRIDVLNALNNTNFVPVSGMVVGTVADNTDNRANGANPDNYDVTTLVTGNQARIVQLTARLRW